MTTTHVFIDTNVALHFQRPDQIDWSKLVGAESVILVAAPILLRELEQQKIHNDSRRLRERAASFIRWLALFLDDPAKDVRPGVRWHFIAQEPMIDFAQARLSRSIADDDLIASVLAYAPEDGGNVCVATGDIGLAVKLQSRNISRLRLPEELRLPTEPDPLEKEVQELRRQAAQRYAPELALTWADGQTHRVIVVPPAVTRPSAKSLDEIRAQLPFLEKRGEEKSSRAELLRRVAELQNIFVSPETVDRYNEQLRVYFSEYEAYLKTLLKLENLRTLISPMKLILKNGGTAPASQIDVMLTFPENLRLFEADKLPVKLKAPTPPGKPGESLADLVSPRSLDVILPHFSRPNIYDFAADMTRNGPRVNSSVDNDMHSVRFTIFTLKHAFDLPLEGYCFAFASREAVQSFQVQYHVSAAELPETITGALHIVVDGKGSETNASA